MNDEAAIEAVFRRLADAWNGGDMEAFGALFEEDADYVVFNGIHLKGRRQIAEVHGQLFQGPLKGTRIEGGGGQTVRMLCPHVALVHSSGGLRRPGESDVSPEQNSVQTFVLVKRGDGWRIAAFQNTRVQVFGPPGG
jgi:uncharacterized protein (TIGR02246 family)